MAPRKSGPPPRAIKDNTLIIDNGAFNIKAGLANPNASPSDCQVIPNCIARDREKKVWIGHQLGNCNDFGEMSFRRPIEKGFVVNWEGERAVWNTSILGPGSALQYDPKETNLILTEAPNCPQVLQTNCDQVIFEEFEFASYCRSIVPNLLTARNPSTPHPPDCALIIDSGYSHTTITPVLRGKSTHQHAKRLTIGGKFLTNQLRELLSVRHFNITDEPWLANSIKEAVCFASADFAGDLERTWRGGQRDRRSPDPALLVDYVLPDFQTRMAGVVKPYDPAAHGKKSTGAAGSGTREPVLTLGNERFTVPELLFRPADVGMREGGLAEVVMQSLEGLPEAVKRGMAANVVCVGGNFNIPGLFERLKSELTQLLPSEWQVNLTIPEEDPSKAAWTTIARAAADRTNLDKWLVTRQEYQENGPNWLLKRFAQGPAAVGQ